MRKDQPSERPQLVILNGPSSEQYRGIRCTPLWGCNRAYLDWPITHLVVIDRFAVANIRKDPPKCEEYWTRTNTLKLPLPPGWQEHHPPGIDSGTLAIEIAVQRGPVLVIGADGILGGSTQTRYHYEWHPNGSRPKVHERFRTTAITQAKQYPGRIQYVWHEPDPDLPVISHNQVQAQLGKYCEDIPWQNHQ